MKRRDFLKFSGAALAYFFVEGSAWASIPPPTLFGTPKYDVNLTNNDCKASMDIGEFYSEKCTKLNNPKYPDGTAYADMHDLPNICKETNIYASGQKDSKKLTPKDNFLKDFREYEGIQEIFQKHNLDPSKFNNLIEDLGDSLEELIYFPTDKDNKHGYMALEFDSKEYFIIPTKPGLLKSIFEFYK